MARNVPDHTPNLVHAHLPMYRDERIRLTSIVIQIAHLQAEARAIGMDYLGVLLEHAHEEAMDRLRDDDLARSDTGDAARSNVLCFSRAMNAAAR